VAKRRALRDYVAARFLVTEKGIDELSPNLWGDVRFVDCAPVHNMGKRTYLVQRAESVGSAALGLDE
jgi:hypothetical protein